MNKPQVKHYAAHGSGMIAYYDATEVDAYLKDLESRVAILDAQEVKLPELEITQADRERSYEANSGWDTTLFCRERQLLDALRAVQAWREVAGNAQRTYCDSVCERLHFHTDECEEMCAAYDALAGKEGE